MTIQNKNVPALRFPEFNENWKETRLSEIGKFNSGTGFPENAQGGKSGVPFYKVSDMNLNGNEFEMKVSNNYVTEEQIKTLKYKPIKQSSIIFAKVGAAIFLERKRIAKDFLIDNNMMSFTPSDNILFLKYLFETLRLSKFAQVGALPSYNSSDIGIIKIKLPAKLEQQKIAAFLTAVDKKIQQFTKKKDLLEQYKKGVMQKIFNQEIRFKDDNGNDFADWEEKKLGEVAKFRRGSFPQPYGLEKWYDDENGAPFVQVFDVDDNWKLKSFTKRKISTEAQNFSVFAEKGTVVLTIQGSIGRIAITQYDSFVDRTLLLFESYKVKIDKIFFMYVVYLLFQIEKEKAPGGTIKTITKEVLTDFTVFLPCIEEQKIIANFLSAIDDKINLVNQQLEKTKEYKKGLLQQMFI